MDQSDNERAVAHELATFARQQGLDLEPIRNDSLFQMDQRWVFFWRKLEGLSWSGSADEKEGTLHYHMQGAISMLPDCLKESASAFRGIWFESGTFDNISQAFDLLKSWLIDRKEVNDLPSRFVKSYGI